MNNETCGSYMHVCNQKLGALRRMGWKKCRLINGTLLHRPFCLDDSGKQATDFIRLCCTFL